LSDEIEAKLNGHSLQHYPSIPNYLPSSTMTQTYSDVYPGEDALEPGFDEYQSIYPQSRSVYSSRNTYPSHHFVHDSVKHLMNELLLQRINPLKAKIVRISGRPYYVQPGPDSLPIYPGHKGYGNIIFPQRRAASLTDAVNSEDFIQNLSEKNIRDDEDDEELRALLEDASLDTQVEKVVLRGVPEEMGHFDEPLNFMRRLALKNDIDGDEVTTAQKLREINLNGKSNRFNSIARRMAVDNGIHGKHVNTAQDATELNAPSSRMDNFPISFDNLDFEVPMKTSRRLALKNDFEGDEVTTAQKMREINLNGNNNELNAIARRMAVDNSIHGKHVNTAQDATELNSASPSLRSRIGKTDLDEELDKLLSEANTLKLL
jgi:hypothetical protein